MSICFIFLHREIPPEELLYECIPGNLVDAGGPVLARIAGALVDVLVAGLAGVAGRALALESVDLVETGGVVLARAAEALVDVEVAVIAGEAGPAEAVIAAVIVDADAVVAERVARYLALVDVLLAVLTYTDNAGIRFLLLFDESQWDF